MATDEKNEITVDEFWEREAGGVHHRAFLLADVGGTCEAAYEELRHDPDADPEVVAALKLLAEYEFTVPVPSGGGGKR